MKVVKKFILMITLFYSSSILIQICQTKSSKYKVYFSILAVHTYFKHKKTMFFFFYCSLFFGSCFFIFMLFPTQSNKSNETNKQKKKQLIHHSPSQRWPPTTHVASSTKFPTDLDKAKNSHDREASSD